jgi:translation initiation factor IF-2
MGGQTVGQFAAELKMPALLLLEQMRAADMAKESADDVISEKEKAKFLDYFRASSETSGRKIA